MILHIIDGTHKNKRLHEETTLDVLKELNAENINTKTIYTRLDLIKEKPKGEFWISNLTSENIDVLIELIYLELFGPHRSVKLSIPYNKQHLINILNEETRVLKTDYENNIIINVIMYEKQIDKFREYVLSVR